MKILLLLPLLLGFSVQAIAHNEFNVPGGCVEDCGSELSGEQVPGEQEGGEEGENESGGGQRRLMIN